jgi:hypothetical protein
MRRRLPWPATALAAVAALLCFPSSAGATIAFVAATSAGNTNGATSLSIAKPTGSQGDLLLATVTATGTGSITAPSGWSAVKETTQGTAIREVTCYKVVGSSEPSSYSWSLGTSRTASGGIIDYSGVNQTVPIDATASGSGASGNAAVPSLTTSATGDEVVTPVSFATSTTVTPDPSTTGRYEKSSNSTTNEAADFVQASAGATATKTASPASSKSAWIAQTIALRDAAQATLSISTSAAPTFSANLDSGDQSPTYTAALTVNDTRTGESAGLGWNLTLTSTQFTSGTHTLATGASTLTGVASACANGGLCASPTNSITYPVTVPAGTSPPAAVKFYNAAKSTGSGLFTVTPTLAVSVPQNSFAGTYTSALTISIVSGP